MFPAYYCNHWSPVSTLDIQPLIFRQFFAMTQYSVHLFRMKELKRFNKVFLKIPP